MRIRRGVLAFILATLLAACTPVPAAAPTLEPPTARPPAAPAAGLPATPPPALTPTCSATPTLLSAPEVPAIEGPLAAGGQALRALVIASQDVRYGVAAQGLWRSDDGGKTWRQVSALTIPTPMAMPGDPNTLYAASSPSCYRDDGDPTLRRSTDGGATWQELPAGKGIQPLIQRPGQPATLYGISCAGLHVSHDGGQTWQIAGPTHGWDITALIPVDNGPFFLLAVLTSEGGTSHLARFDEQGQLVQDDTQGLNFWGRGILAGAAGSLYLADSTGVRRSSDGRTWQLFNSGLSDVVLAEDPLQAGVPREAMDRGFGLLALAIDPADPGRLALGTVRGLYISEDRGEHWHAAGDQALAQRRVNAVAWDPVAPGTLYATTPEGIFAVRLPAQ